MTENHYLDVSCTKCGKVHKGSPCDILDTPPSEWKEEDTLVHFLMGVLGFTRQNDEEAAQNCINEALEWFRGLHKSNVESAQNTTTDDSSSSNLPPSPSEEWEKEVRDWWYSVQEDCMGMMHTLPEAKRVDLEHLFNKTLTQQRERLVREIEGMKNIPAIETRKGSWIHKGYQHALDRAIEAVKRVEVTKK